MKFDYILAAILVGTGITGSVQTQANANPVLDSVSTNDLRKIAQEITVLVSHSQGNGSGVIIARRGKSFYVLTASHVVKFDSTYQITTPDRRQYQAAIIIRKLPNLDLAILEFQSEQNYQVASLADYEHSEKTSFVGGNIYISGWDRAQISNQPVFTCGVTLTSDLASLIRKDPISDGYELVYTNITQAGFSGSPILDNQGQVIGIHGRAEGEELESIGSLTLGLSLGIPIKKFLELVKQSSIQLPLVIDNKLPNNPLHSSWSGSDPCENYVPPKPTDNAIDWANYANSMLRMGNLVDALSAYDEAIKKNINGELYQIWYGRGLSLILLNRPNEALKTFDQALQLWSQLLTNAEQKQHLDLARALLLRYKGALLSASERYQEALAVYDEALRIKPNNYQIWMQKAGILQELNLYSEAITAYTMAIQIEPRSLLFQARSKLYFQNSQYNLAIEYLNSAIQLNPYDAQVYAMRGAMRKKLGDAKGSENDYEQVDKLTSQLSVGSRMRYGSMLIGFAELSVGNIKEANQTINQVISGFGGERMRAMTTGIFQQFFSQSDQLENPQVSVERMISLIRNYDTYDNKTDLDESTIHLIKAYFYLQYANPIHNYNEITKNVFNEIEQAIKLNINNQHIYIAYAMRSAFRDQKSDEQGAKEDFDRALKIAPNPLEVYLTRGQIRLILKNKKGALADFQTAAKMSYEQKDIENYQKIMSLIDRIQNSPD